MGDRRLVNYQDNIISKKEKDMVNKIISKYNFNIIDIVKEKDFYIIETNEGYRCLKKIKHGKYKIRNAHKLVNQLTQNDFDNIVKYYKTDQNSPYVKYKKCIFYLTDYLEGEDCNLNILEEAKECSKLLGRFHNISSNLDTSKIELCNKIKDWPKIISKSLNNLEKFKRYIDKKKARSQFDLIYSENLQDYYERSITSLKFINNSYYYDIVKATNNYKKVCYNRFYNKNILKSDEKYYIIDLDNIVIDIQINDLANFIVRLMNKKTYQWDFQKAKEIIECYGKENSLCRQDWEILFSLIMFPYKFCKLGRKRYIKKKHWSEIKYENKLNKIVKNHELEKQFMIDYLSFLEAYKSN